MRLRCKSFNDSLSFPKPQAHSGHLFQPPHHVFVRVFPADTPEAAESLFQTILELEPCLPHFVSVTYGVGGSTRELTHDLVTYAPVSPEVVEWLTKGQIVHNFGRVVYSKL